MKLFLFFLAMAVSSISYADKVRVLAYSPIELSGVPAANEFRVAMNGSMPTYISSKKVTLITKKCRLGLIGQKDIPLKKRENLLTLLKGGEVKLKIRGADILMAPLPEGAEDLNYVPDGGLVYFVPATPDAPSGTFILAYTISGTWD